MKHLILLFALSSLFFTNCKKAKTPPANEVYMENNQYSPSSMTVSVGTTIKWTNQESMTHTVTSDTLGIFSSGNLTESQTFSFTFNTVGTFPYHCVHHSGMKGTIIVQ